MQTTELAPRTHARPSQGFSLGEATRIRRDLVSDKADIHCPRCDDLLASVSTRGAQELVWVATCHTCRASVMVQVDAKDLR
jgi:hypothetical protein